LKKSTGEVLAVNEIREKNSNIVKNYGITIKYNSRSRHAQHVQGVPRRVPLRRRLSRCTADLVWSPPCSLFQHSDRRHSGGPCVRSAIKRYNPELHGDDVPIGVKRPIVKQFINSKIKFPLPHRIQRV